MRKITANTTLAELSTILAANNLQTSARFTDGLFEVSLTDPNGWIDTGIADKLYEALGDALQAHDARRGPGVSVTLTCRPEVIVYAPNKAIPAAVQPFFADDEPVAGEDCPGCELLKSRKPEVRADFPFFNSAGRMFCGNCGVAKDSGGGCHACKLAKQVAL